LGCFSEVQAGKKALDGARLYACATRFHRSHPPSYS
jgi:hypothetical protein